VIALGWTFEAAEPPAPLKRLEAEGCAIVGVAGKAGGTARDRLRAQVSCVRVLPAFLPIAPDACVGADVALNHARQHGAVIAERLAALAGRAQISLCACWDPPAGPHAGATGRDWLCARAARLARDTERAAAVTAELRAVLGSWPVDVVRGSGQIRAHALVEADAVAATLRRVAEGLADRPALAGARLAATGPWPAFSFCRAA
jgi:hypothetical protein